MPDRRAPPMDAGRVAELYRLHDQGGLATGRALKDFPAAGIDSLMFLKGDVVLLLEDGADGTWGFCEGVVGRFKLSHVDFPDLDATIRSRRGPARPPSFLSGYSLASHGSVSDLTHDSEGSHSPFLAGLEETARRRAAGTGLEELEDADQSTVILDLPDERSEPRTPRLVNPGARRQQQQGRLAGSSGDIFQPRTPGEDSTFEFDSSSSSTPSDSIASLPQSAQQDLRHALAAALPGNGPGKKAQGSGTAASREAASRQPESRSLREPASSTPADARFASPEPPLRRESEASSMSTHSSRTEQTAGRRSPERRSRRSSAPGSPERARLPPRPAKSPSRQRASGKSTPSSSASSSPRGSFRALPPSSSASLASLGLPPIQTVRTHSPTFSPSVSSSTISSDGRGEAEVGEIFDAYGRESMYAPPEDWLEELAEDERFGSMPSSISAPAMLPNDFGLSFSNGAKPRPIVSSPQKPRPGGADQRKKRQSMMSFAAVHPVAAPPLPTIPSLSTSTQTSVEISDDSPTTPTAPQADGAAFVQTVGSDAPFPLSPDSQTSAMDGGVHASLGATLLGLRSPIGSPDTSLARPATLPSISPPNAPASSWSNPLSLASDLRKRILERTDSSSSTPVESTFEGEQVVLAGERSIDAGRLDESSALGSLTASSLGQDEQDAQRVAATARNIPSFSTNSGRTTPALTIDTGRQIPSATSQASAPGSDNGTRSRSGSNPRPSPGAAAAALPTSNRVDLGRGAYASPPLTPKGLQSSPTFDVFSVAENLHTNTASSALHPTASGSVSKAPKPAFFNSRPRSQSFNGQTVEIGFPVHYESASGSPRSFATISTSPKSPSGINARPSLTSLGIGENMALPDMPQRRPTIDPRSADRPSPLSAPPTTASGGESESPRSASASRFEPLQAFPRVFGRGQADRSVSAKADLSSTRNATPVASPIKDEDDSGPKRGLKGFFTRARSKSDARPPVDRAALRQPEQPPVPSSASSHNLQEASARPSMSSITRPSVAALDTRANLPPLPPPLEQPSSAASVDSSQQSPVVRTPQSAHTALPTAIQGGKGSVASPATSGPPRREEPTLVAPARRPSQQATSPASAAIGDRATPRSILKSPRSPAAVRNSPSSPEATPLKVPASQRHFADLMQQDAETAESSQSSPITTPRSARIVPALSPREPPPRSSPPPRPSQGFQASPPPRPSQQSAQASPPPRPQPSPASAVAVTRKVSAPTPQRARRPSGPPLEVDDFGFHLAPGQRRPIRPPPLSPEDTHLAEQKLRAVLAGPSPAPALKDKKTRKLFRAGLPPSIRGEVWMFFSGATERREVGQWPKLLAEAKATDEMAKDVEAAFQDHAHFNEPYSGLRDLLDVTRCYAKLNSRLPYQSTLVPLAGVALLQVPPEDALYLIAVMADRLKGYFDKALQIDSLVWVYLLEATDKALARRLVIEGRVDMTKILGLWLLPMFVRILPFATVLRVWDMFFLEGITFLLRVALAMVVVSKSRLMDDTRLHSPQMIEHFLLNLPHDELLSADVLLATADGLKVGMKDDDMKKWRKKAVDTLISSRAAQAEHDRKMARGRR